MTKMREEIMSIESLFLLAISHSPGNRCHCTHDKLVVEEHLDEIEDILPRLYGVIVPVCPTIATAPRHAGLDQASICLN
jgi:hypothetical protein